MKRDVEFSQWRQIKKEKDKSANTREQLSSSNPGFELPFLTFDSTYIQN